MKSSLNGGSKGGAANQSSGTSNSNSKRVRANNNRNTKNNGRSLPRQSTKSMPAAYSTETRSVRSRNISMTDRSHRFRGREFVGNVTDVNNAYTPIKFALNPGVAATFPVLSIEASTWEQYKFHALKFEYITRTGTTKLGSLLMSPDYDAEDAPPGSEAIATSYQDACEDSQYRNLVCKLDPQAMFPIGPRKFIRSGPVGDLKTYDAGNLYLGAIGDGTTTIGKLWVEYDVEFFVKQLNPSAESSSDMTFLSMTSANTWATGVAESIPWDTTVVNPIGVTVAALGVLTLPKGAYLVTYSGTFIDSAAEAFIVLGQFLKNGAALANPIFWTSSRSASTANGQVNVAGQCYVVSSGTDTIEVSHTLTGAAGTLTSTANSQQLSIRLI